MSPGESIQAAIDAAAAGETIQVAAGTYLENLLISGKAIVLLGGFPAGGDFSTRNPLANLTALRSAGGDAVISFDEANGGVVDGFVISGGSGHRVPDFSPGHGGGIYVNRSGVRISNNVVENNSTSCNQGSECFGGGIFVGDYDSTDYRTVEIFGNVVRNNTAARGAGIGVNGGAVTIRDNLVEGNTATSDHGGGMYLCGNLRIVRNIVRGNTVGLDLGYGWGGGILAFESCGPAHFEHNRVTNNRSLGPGSGVFLDEGVTAEFNGDLIYANACGTGGGSALYVDGSYDGRGSTARLTNVTVASHDCSGAGNGLYVEGGSSVDVRNSIFYGNGTGQVAVVDAAGAKQPSVVRVEYTLIDGVAGTGNIDADPLFVDPSAADFHLRPGSPAIDAADPAAAVGDEPEPNGGRRDLGSYGGTSGAAASGGGG